MYWLSTDKFIGGKSCLCPGGGIESIEITLNVNYCNLVGVNFNNLMPPQPTDYSYNGGKPIWYIS